jgi:hypothetical protein
MITPTESHKGSLPPHPIRIRPEIDPAGEQTVGIQTRIDRPMPGAGPWVTRLAGGEPR